MQLVSFDVFRTLGIPEAKVLKPEQMFSHKELLQQADWVLFPEYWQLSALVYGLGCKVFPSLPSYYVGHDKVEMTRAFEMVAPENTPLTLIEPNTPVEQDKIWDLMPLPFVAKLPKASMGEGVWLINDRRDWQQYCERSPVLYVQEYLPIDRDLRIVVVGGRVLTAYWRLQAEQGFYNNVARGGEVEYGEVPQNALDLALQLAETLGVNHAGFDVAMVGGHPYVLEFNRLFGNQGLRDNTALADAIRGCLQPQSPPDDPDHPRHPPGLPEAV